MCGIAGWIDWQEDVSGKPAIIETMIGRLSHRGPDAHDVWLSPRAALAHHRLAVIDPHAGRQPIIYQAGGYTYVMVFNGELYNFRELRSELSTRGHIFESNSDTEVLLHTYLEWGEKCTQHLNGIFAFGVWDESKQQLFLARDHQGANPLFYAQRGSTLVFASEIKALLAHPHVKPRVDADGLASLFTCVPLHTPGSTVYADIHQVRAGEQIVFTRECTRAGCYWTLRSAPHTDDLPTTRERIRALVDDAIKRQLITDFPVVAALSGDMDSSGLVALAAREFQREDKGPLHTYSIDFVESQKYLSDSPVETNLCELPARRVSAHLGTEHHTILVNSAELLENLLAPVYAHDMPSFFGQLDTSMYLLSKAMRRDATVAVSSETTDEIFGSSTWFFSDEARTANKFPWQTALLGDEVSPWWSADVINALRPQEYLAQRYEEAREEVPVLEGEDPFNAKMREISYMSQTRFLPVLLDRNDRMSMAVGLEARLPFADYRLVEYAWNIPWEMKTIGGMEKGLLLYAFADILPNGVRHQKKSPHLVSQYPEYQQGVSRWLLHVLNDANAPIRPFLNMPAACALAEGSLPDTSRSFRVCAMEHIIKMNAWLQEYQISLC